MWMELETVIQSSKSEKQMPYNIAYMWYLENAIDDIICKAEIETQM